MRKGWPPHCLEKEGYRGHDDHPTTVRRRTIEEGMTTSIPLKSENMRRRRLEDGMTTPPPLEGGS